MSEPDSQAAASDVDAPDSIIDSNVQRNYATEDQPQMRSGMCAAITCTTESTLRCARCHVFFYCSR